MDYAIGDVQGCFDALERLLKHIDFNADKDRLFFLGDVVNRGNASLKTLRFIKTLHHQGNAQMVLGNHDFHLLRCVFTNQKPNKKDTFGDILSAPDKSVLIDFLTQQPLIIQHLNNLLVHAGIPPQWDKKEALMQAHCVEQLLRGDNLNKILKKLYREKPKKWRQSHTPIKKACYTVNALMRMRFCGKKGRLEFNHKSNFNKPPKGFAAWFEHPRKTQDNNIIFGHWSTLDNVNKTGIYPMDTGCVWGRCLSAIRLSDKQIFTTAC